LNTRIRVKIKSPPEAIYRPLKTPVIFGLFSPVIFFTCIMSKPGIVFLIGFLSCFASFGHK